MTKIMGIINLTDDSFYAASRTSGSGAAERAAKMLEEGADILDLGACSTRPGSKAPSAEEEWRRLEPALQAIAEGKVFSVAKKNADAIGNFISVDTYRSEIVRRVYDTIGPFLVNDISAGQMDPEMLKTVGGLGLPYVAMHMRGTPETMQQLTDYPTDITSAVSAYFQDFSHKADDNGIRDWILDPGFGFAKTVEQNYQLLMHMDRLQSFGRPILVGVSRKSMIYRLLGITPEEALAPTQVVHFKALEKGADILRVHDVAEAVRTVRLYSTMYTSSPGAANL